MEWGSGFPQAEVVIREHPDDNVHPAPGGNCTLGIRMAKLMLDRYLRPVLAGPLGANGQEDD